MPEEGALYFDAAALVDVPLRTTGDGGGGLCRSQAGGEGRHAVNVTTTMMSSMWQLCRDSLEHTSVALRLNF